MDDDQRGEWFQTYTGRKFYPFDPRPEEVDFDDITHALSLLCRFAGHVWEFYSVAQHSVLVSQLCPPGLALAGLLHDAHEAYTGDLIRSIKRTLRKFTDAYDKASERIQAAIHQALGVSELTAAACEGSWGAERVRAADTLALLIERRDLLSEGPGRWREDDEFPGLAAALAAQPRILPYTPSRAALMFTARYAALRAWPPTAQDEPQEERR